MKKYKCTICGGEVTVKDDIYTCINCKTIQDKDILFKENPLKLKQLKAKNNILNREFKKNIDLLDDTNDNLLLEYYKLYSYKALNKDYDESNFYNFNKSYTSEELDIVILHMLEHNMFFSNEDIELLINKSQNKEKYIKILNNIYNTENEKTIEKDLRELLFPKTIIPQAKKKNKRKADGKRLLILSLVLFILFIGITLIFINDEIKYEIMNISLIIPSYVLVKSLSKFIFKKDNIYILIGMFIVIYFDISFILSLFVTNFDTNIISHFMGIIKTPYELIKAMAESTGK